MGYKEMADYSEYEMHICGTKKAVFAIYASMPSADIKTITYENGTEDDYILYFKNTCKWGVDANCDKKWDGREIDLSSLDEEKLRNEQGADDFKGYTLADKSAMFHCEIEISEWSDYGESFAHYKDGQQLEYMEGNLDPEMLAELGVDFYPDNMEESDDDWSFSF